MEQTLQGILDVAHEIREMELPGLDWCVNHCYISNGKEMNFIGFHHGDFRCVATIVTLEDFYLLQSFASRLANGIPQAHKI